MFSTRSIATIAVALLAVTAGCAGLVPGSAPGTTSQGPTAQGNGPAEPMSVTNAVETPSAASLEPAPNYTALYDRTIDSVVQITVQRAQGQSQGSGFVYSSEGYVITNQHVVGSSDTVQVRFQSGAWRTGDVVGTDVYTDLAVVHVESLPAGVDALPLARQDPEPGQPVVALGSPYGLEGSITHGIVSGLNRSMPTTQGFAIPDTVQTDAAINPGNSGGPLVSMRGTVVGVNRARAGDNLGFAISADVVRRVVPHLIRNGSYHHSYLGVRTTPVTPRIADANGMDRARGLMVTGVLRDGPADGHLQYASLRRTDDGGTVPVDGDVVLAIEGIQVDSERALTRVLLFRTHPGEEVSLTVLQDGERRTETIILGSRPEGAAGQRV